MVSESWSIVEGIMGRYADHAVVAGWIQQGGYVGYMHYEPRLDCLDSNPRLE